FAGFVTSAMALDVTIPDPGLDAAVRTALNKPTGTLTDQDLLNLTILSADNRNIASIAGLETARNLVALELLNNRLTNFSLPAGLTNLTFLDVSANPLTNFSLPTGLTHLEDLFVESTPLINLTLPT